MATKLSFCLVIALAVTTSSVTALTNWEFFKLLEPNITGNLSPILHVFHMPKMIKMENDQEYNTYNVFWVEREIMTGNSASMAKGAPLYVQCSVSHFDCMALTNLRP